MNLNEECLLQFLKHDAPLSATGASFDTHADAIEPGTLTADLKRVLRRRHYVSFPLAILLRRFF